MTEQNRRHVTEAGHIIEQAAWIEPLALFAPLAHEPFALFLDSASAPQGARWSFIATDPFTTLTAKNGRPRAADHTLSIGPFEAVEQRLTDYACDPGWTAACGLDAEDCPPFTGGAAGYFGYELGHDLERLTRAPKDTLDLPDMALGAYDTVLAFDHLKRRTFLISTGLPEKTPAARAARAQARLTPWRARLALAPKQAPSAPNPPSKKPEVSSPTSRPNYEAAIAGIIEHIYAGDIFQANLSRKQQAPLAEEDDAWTVYQRLRTLSPAPFAAFFQFPGATLLSSSPERFLKCRDRAVVTEPIKGTRPRGQTQEEDIALTHALTASEKDRAENIMIVDLMRNDLSRVCVDGTVKVTELCGLHSFATVHHLVSTVKGRLRDEVSLVGLLTACFPGGSITGAPKLRAMDIITAREGDTRGPYCGAIGYLGFDGAMDTSIAIRIAVVKDRIAHFQAGGAIVAGSDPATEFDETNHKARAIAAAIRGEEQTQTTPATDRQQSA